MDELRVVRREDQHLIVANEAGVEFRLVVDATALADLRNLSRQSSSGPRVSPRLIQSLVRAGKSREEIAEETGADESDIDRYEEPVLAERRFVLSSAQAVPVRTSPAEQSEQQFGTVIAERLIALNAKNVVWASWRDEEAGWMIGLNFDSYDVAHRAVWSFEHRKNLLAPITPDATSLSKQGEVGDRLIPKLRAVDTADESARFDSGAFDHEKLPVDEADEAVTLTSASAETGQPSPSLMSPATEAAVRAGHPSTGSIPIVNMDAEYARRREIEQRAIKSPDPDLPDLGQTADLLDALRRRRGEREDTTHEDEEIVSTQHSEPVQIHRRDLDSEPVADFSGPRAVAPSGDEPEVIRDPHDESNLHPETRPEPSPEPAKRKGRTPVPSWDDILFGTRSEEDPI